MTACACGCVNSPVQKKSRYAHGHNRKKHQIGWDTDISTGCWNWTGRITPDGYAAQLHFLKRPILPHRLYYTLIRGQIPAGYQLDHLCRNRKCVNPFHLEAVTQTENVRRGSASKLTAKDVSDIRAILGGKKKGTHALSRKYGVSPDTIRNIRKGESWRGI